MDKEYESLVPIKQNFDETFNQTSFVGTYERVEKTRHGTIKRGKDGNRVKIKQPRKKGIVREDVLEKHGLSHHSAQQILSHHFFLSNVTVIQLI